MSGNSQVAGRRRSALVAALIGFVSLLAAVSPGPTAAAAPGAPIGLSPSGVTISGSPTLSWTRVRGATYYQVDISDDPTFSTSVLSINTTNRRYTPQTHLRADSGGHIYWRVRSVGPTGTSAPRSTSFSRNALAGPNLLAPADGAVLAQDDPPPVLSWSPVPGAVYYTIQVDTDNSFVAPFTIDNVLVSNTSYLIPNPLISQVYDWRVKATLASGIETNWSTVRIFQPSPLAAATLNEPVDSPSTQVVDVVLDWNPVPRAVRYDLQLSTDQNFLSGVTTYNNLVGTRFSPPTTLSNDQYWWRVRPYDAGGNFLQWTQVPVWTFQRYWPDQPALVYPANNTIVDDPFYFQWTAVPHASYYQFELHNSPDFEPANQICSRTTVNTTYVPTAANDCWPGANGNYYWRVIAHDGPVDVVTDRISSQVGHFQYQPDVMNLATTVPADGASVSVPTLTWAPIVNAAKYVVTVTDVANSQTVVSAVTSATSFTPRDLLTVGHTYRWSVLPYSGSGRAGSQYAPQDWNTFTMTAQAAAVASTPEATGPADGSSFVRFPTLTWTPVANAAFYKIGLRPRDTIQAFTLLGDNFRYPAGEDASSTYLATGDWEWKVFAYDGSNTQLSQTVTPRWFTMANLLPPTNLTASMSGNASASADTRCAIVLPDQCPNMPATPVLRWDPVPSAGYYKVTLSRDKEMTSIISTTQVDENMFTPTAALADSQAGAAYHWYVQSCKADNKCSPLQHANNAFNKTSNPVKLASPADQSVVTGQVTFIWDDWLVDNKLDTGADPSTGVTPQVEAYMYRIQVSTDAGFQNVIDDRNVDQTTYTPYDRAYPEGPLYWRVLPYDGTGNPLAWSDAGDLAPWWFDKQSPKPTLVSPAAGATTTQTDPFLWQPVDYADHYDIEIYRNNDDSASNRIVSTSSKLVAFTPSSPLAASSLAYKWRVRAVNASSLPGPWSDFRSFKVTGAAPTQTAPSAGVWVKTNDGYFTWTAVQGAASYRFDRRPVGSNGIAESIGTVALAWAPQSALGDGRWEWRAVALDANNQVIGASGWRSFRVDSTAPTVVSMLPQGTVSPSTNFNAKFSERVRNVNSTTMKLFQVGHATALPAVVKLSTDGKTAVLNPNSNLLHGKSYVIKLSSGIKDVAGNALAATKWQVVAK
jgi:hypothetical protein